MDISTKMLDSVLQYTMRSYMYYDYRLIGLTTLVAFIFRNLQTFFLYFYKCFTDNSSLLFRSYCFGCTYVHDWHSPRFEQSLLQITEKLKWNSNVIFSDVLQFIMLLWKEEAYYVFFFNIILNSYPQSVICKYVYYFL